MREIIINSNEAGQRFDKYLFKYFKEAPASFIYKMLRKKNIVLNGRKSDGKDKLSKDDVVKIFMSEETVAKFRGTNSLAGIPKTVDLDIVYEDNDIIVVNKPSGILSQKADSKDISINEYIISYLIDSKKLTAEDLNTFKPSICNRLDRNTSGLIVAGKSLKGLQMMSSLFKERTLSKYYLALVHGRMEDKGNIKGYLYKDVRTNKVTVENIQKESSQYIETEYEPIRTNGNVTLLKVKLVTGKAHQIRAHLASVDHFIIGDYKYGKCKINNKYKEKYGIDNQLLHSWKLIINGVKGIPDLELKAKLPENFYHIINEELGNISL